MSAHTVNVQQIVKVTVDEAKFTPEFMAEFRKYMQPFTTVDEHVKHLATLFALGVYDNSSFIEGYGNAKDFGIEFEALACEAEMESTRYRASA